MIVLEKYKVHWVHTQVITHRTSRRGNIISINNATSQCIITNTVLNTASSSATMVHWPNKYDRKKGILESFKAAVSRCPSKDLRDAFWAEYWKIRKPTITVSEETADLLKCADYIHSKVKELIIRDESTGYNDEWRTWVRPDILKRLSNRLGMYRDKSDHSLLAIIKICIVGFINFKRLKDATIHHKNSK